MMHAYGKTSSLQRSNFGEADPYSATSAQEFLALVRNIQDPYRKAEVLKVRIAHVKSIPVFPGKKIVIETLEAQLRAAERQIAELETGKQYTEEWRELGQTSLVLTQGLLIALTAAAVVGTVVLLRRSR